MISASVVRARVLCDPHPLRRERRPSSDAKTRTTIENYRTLQGRGRALSDNSVHSGGARGSGFEPNVYVQLACEATQPSQLSVRRGIGSTLPRRCGLAGLELAWPRRPRQRCYVSPALINLAWPRSAEGAAARYGNLWEGNGTAGDLAR
jgi:hypothetical protein